MYVKHTADHLIVVFLTSVEIKHSKANVQTLIVDSHVNFPLDLLDCFIPVCIYAYTYVYTCMIIHTRRAVCIGEHTDYVVGFVSTSINVLNANFIHVNGSHLWMVLFQLICFRSIIYS